jgi:hypothetical protein
VQCPLADSGMGRWTVAPGCAEGPLFAFNALCRGAMEGGLQVNPEGREPNPTEVA